MNPAEFLELARELSRRDDASEAARRSTTSRAYYATFNALAEELEARVGKLPRSGAHDHLIRWIKNSKVVGAELLADKLADLRDRRVEADYLLRFATPSVTTARLHVASAAAIVGEFQALPRPALYEGILAYRKAIGQG